MPVWSTKNPDEGTTLKALAEVDMLVGETEYRDVLWDGYAWTKGGQPLKAGVIRWTLLEPIITERADKRKPDVTRLVDLLTELQHVPDGTLDKPGMARNHCSTLIKQFAKIYGNKDPRPPEEMVEEFIRATMAHPYHGSKATNFGYLVTNRKAIINDLRHQRNNGRHQSAADKLAEGLRSIAAE